jgi:sugar phosphate isomerase/epimerase
MSGLPGAPGDKYPNWITVAWPPETTKVLEWQWNEVLIPYWKELVAFSRKKGIRRLCLELHGGQNVYNVATLKRLRDACGETVGVNFDPSHLMWMGADPIAAIEALGEAIFHVHAKDTRIDPRNAALNSRIETLPSVQAARRSWNYVTLGYGNGEPFWREFCLALRRVGYDGVLSIEHEDMAMSPMEGMRKSVELLRRVIMTEKASYELPKI